MKRGAHPLPDPPHKGEGGPSGTRKIQRLALIGTGVIGSGWAARALANGLDVVAWDPAPGVERRLRAAIRNAWPALKAVGLRDGASPRRLTFARDLASAVEGADFVQESGPEEEVLKRSLLGEIDRVARPNVVIGSSSSGLLPTRIQNRCRHPERVVIGHPFNPVYLLPLVEIVAGERTSAATVKRASTFYRSLGMRPLLVRREIEGYISDRLQEAIWREALHMVADGVATPREIDEAIVYGPGLRWAFMGAFLSLHLAGGDRGMQHALEQFGPTLKLPWTKLRAPELTPELFKRVVDGTTAQANGRSVKALERWRDAQLIRIMAVTGA